MAEATSRPRKTVEDYLALPDDVRAELIDGELYMTPAPTGRHQRITLHLATLLEARLQPPGQPWLVLPAPFDVHLPSGEVVQPDVVVLRAPEPPACLEGVPEVAIEVLSPTRREHDRIVKKALYGRNGVPEYWIVDPEDCSIEVFLHRAGRYEPGGWFTPGTVLRSPALEGVGLPVDAVFGP